LTNAVDSVNRLRLRHRVPMRFDDMDVVCRCEVESKKRISMIHSVQELGTSLPFSSTTDSGQHDGAVSIFGKFSQHVTPSFETGAAVDATSSELVV
jgi:hypothetical protein